MHIRRALAGAFGGQPESHRALAEVLPLSHLAPRLRQRLPSPMPLPQPRVPLRLQLLAEVVGPALVLPPEHVPHEAVLVGKLIQNHIRVLRDSPPRVEVRPVELKPRVFELQLRAPVVDVYELLAPPTAHFLDGRAPRRAVLSAPVRQHVHVAGLEGMPRSVEGQEQPQALLLELRDGVVVPVEHRVISTFRLPRHPRCRQAVRPCRVSIQQASVIEVQAAGVEAHLRNPPRDLIDLRLLPSQLIHQVHSPEPRPLPALPCQVPVLHGQVLLGSSRRRE